MEGTCELKTWLMGVVCWFEDYAGGQEKTWDERCGFRGKNKSWPSSLGGGTGINKISIEIVVTFGRRGPWSQEVGHLA